MTYVHSPYLAESVFEWEMLQIKVAGKSYKENQNTHFMFNTDFSASRAVYEVVCKNMLQLDRPRIDNMAHALCITKATNPHSEHVIILIVLPQQQRFRKRASLIR